MKIVFTKHAKFRMKERKVSFSEVKETIINPAKLCRKSTEYLAMKIRENKHLLLVYYVIDDGKIKVITVITTSKISKYLN